MKREIETVPVNIYGDTAEVIRGSSAGYSDYLARYEAAEDKAAFNASYFGEKKS